MSTNSKRKGDDDSSGGGPSKRKNPPSFGASSGFVDVGDLERLMPGASSVVKNAVIFEAEQSELAYSRAVAENHFSDQGGSADLQRDWVHNSVYADQDDTAAPIQVPGQLPSDYEEDDYGEDGVSEGSDEEDDMDADEEAIANMQDTSETNDGPIDRVRSERVMALRTNMQQRIESGEGVTPSEARQARLFTQDKTNRDTERRMNNDVYGLVFQPGMHKDDDRIYKHFGKDPGRKVCFGCTHPPINIASGTDIGIQKVVDLYFRNISFSDPITNCEGVSIFANETVIKDARRRMLVRLESAHPNHTPQQLEALNIPFWTPASVFYHFNHHTINPMTFLLKAKRREHLIQDSLWRRMMRRDNLGADPMDNVSKQEEYLYDRSLRRSLILERENPAKWNMPNIHTIQLLSAIGVMSYRKVDKHTADGQNETIHTNDGY